MKKLIFTALLICLAFIIYGQQSTLEAFNNLINKTWKAEGIWGDGSTFKQEVSFEFVSDKKYKRTISGTVKEEPTSYTFEFEKRE